MSTDEVMRALSLEAERIFGRPPPTTPLPAESRTEYIVAHRAWWAVHLGHDVAFLRSWTREAVWTMGEPFVVTGEIPARPSPFSVTWSVMTGGMTSAEPPGVYAYKAIDKAKTHQGSSPDCGGARVVRVFGEVALWGRVIEHELGYRAEKAYPLRIVCPDIATASALRNGYGCETEVG